MSDAPRQNLALTDSESAEASLSSLKGSSIDLAPGTVIAGRYELVRCLGFGSVGVVFSCFHRDLPDRCFAIKFLHAPSNERHLDSESLMGRFRNELMASYQVNHPNVVRAFDYIEEGEMVAFTMEHVGGGDLWNKINNHKELPLKSVVDILSQICSGVQAIHDVGIIHRDLKPENILVAIDDTLKISDFGIARIQNGKQFTAQGGVVGTFDYMSPEYLKGSACDERSDIFSVGILAYLLLTGESPFSNKSLVDSIMSRIESSVTPPHALNPKCPPTLSAVVLKALEPDPANRYQSASEMLYHLSALRFAMHRESIQAEEKPESDADELAGNSTTRPAAETAKTTQAATENDNRIDVSSQSGGSSSNSHHRGNSRRLLSISVLACSIIFFVAMGLPTETRETFTLVAEWIRCTFPSLEGRVMYENDEDRLSSDKGFSTDVQRKATLLYKMVNHLTPTRSEGDHVTICILGSDPFGPYIDSITSRTRTIRNQNYIIERIPSPKVTANQLRSCTVAYVAPGDENSFDSALKTLGASNVLIVSDGTGTGAIDFVKESGGRINFRVDSLKATEQGVGSGSPLLQISSPKTGESPVTAFKADELSKSVRQRDE